MDRLGLSVYELARRADMQRVQLARVLKSEGSLTMEQTAALSRVLDVTSDELLQRLGVPGTFGVPVTGEVLASGEVTAVPPAVGLHAVGYPPGRDVTAAAFADRLGMYLGAYVLHTPSTVSDCIGRLAVIAAPGDPLRWLGTLETRRPAGYTARPFRGGPDRALASVAVASRVVAILFSHS